MIHAKKLGRWRAESLIETVVAITVIALGTVSAMTLVRTSLDGNTIIGEKVVAVNLALEGLEAMQNLRDSNYLALAGDVDTCWNRYEVASSVDCGSAPQISSSEDYVLKRAFDFEGDDPALSWTLKRVSNPADGELSFYESESGFVFYAQAGLAEAEYEALEESVYRRILSVSLSASDAYVVTSTVTWMQGELEKSISLSRSIAHVY